MDSSGSNDTLNLDYFSPMDEASSLAYVRPVSTENGKGFAVCASDGTQLAVFTSRDAAYYAARQHDLEPVYLH